MEFSLDDRTCALSVGEFAGFTLGPRDSGLGGAAGVWRAQLGQQWHGRLRAETERSVGDGTVRAAAFELPVAETWHHRGWAFVFTGRIDQVVTAAGAAVIREIKTVAGPLPAPEAELRADHPDYFLQAAAYLALRRPALLAPGSGSAAVAAELVFVELGTGLVQAVALGAGDETQFQLQLDRLVEFLELRRRARERLRALRFRPPFAALRPGQETIQADLLGAFGEAGSRGSSAGLRSPGPSTPVPRPSTVVLFEAPTGYGKTGVLLEFALDRLRAGRFARVLYLTGKSTGQIQVMDTLAAMTALPAAVGSRGTGVGGGPPATPGPGPSTPVAAWQVRPKAEHCINTVFHCRRDACAFLADQERRWPESGLARFYLSDDQPRDLESLRAAGRAARLCPYEITRAALPFNDLWIGDYNYVFAPDSRGVFYERLGFDPAQTLLLIDEAHNLPSRVADAWSHAVRAGDAEIALAELHRIRAPAALLLAWEGWCRLLAGLRHADALDLAAEDDVREAVDRVATLVAITPLDHAALGPQVSELLWEAPSLRDWLAGEFALHDGAGPAPGGTRPDVPTLLWCPRAGDLHFTCLDAAALIGRTLRTFAGVVLASATLEPPEAFATACGLDEPPPETGAPEPAGPSPALGKLSRRARRALQGLTSGAALLQLDEARAAAQPHLLRARTPWRDHAYRVGIDTRVDTTFQHRSRHFGATAATVEALHAAARAAVAVFFPSYAYAESIRQALADAGSPLRATVQPRSAGLAAQAAWVEESLAAADALFLVLGSSFAESIDLLGGRVTHALVVGPALPEVNAIQRSRLAGLERAGLAHAAAFRRVYQIPGMQKVNQALGRLVRAPGQAARVLLHCRRFAETSYASLLAPEYREGRRIATDAELAAWLGGAGLSLENGGNRD